MEEIDIINVWRKETKTKRMLKNYRGAKNSRFNNQYAIWQCMLWFSYTPLIL